MTALHKKWSFPLSLSWRRPLSYRNHANQWTGFYMITASVMKELRISLVNRTKSAGKSLFSETRWKLMTFVISSNLKHTWKNQYRLVLYEKDIHRLILNNIQYKNMVSRIFLWFHSLVYKNVGWAKWNATIFEFLMV